MIIDLNKSGHKQNIKFDKGDILVFSNGEKYKYYLLTYNNIDNYYGLISLHTSEIHQKWMDLNNMIKYCNNPLNTDDFKLIEVVKSNQVILTRNYNE